MIGRTVILVSHHVQMCAPGAAYVVALENGSVQYEGGKDDFMSSSVMKSLVQSQEAKPTDEKQDVAVEELAEPTSGKETEVTTKVNSPDTSSEELSKEKKKPRKLVEEERRAVGRISKEVWNTYLKACGGALYWATFVVALLLATMVPVADHGWLKCVCVQFYITVLL